MARRRRGWHNESLTLIAGGVAAAFVLAMIALWFGPIGGSWSLFGPALDLILATQAVPAVIAVVTFWVVFRLEAIDRKYHRFED